MDVVLWNSLGREVTLELNTKVGTVPTANKVPPTLIPKVIEENIPDEEDDEKIQCKSAQVDLSSSKSKEVKVDPEEILQKVDLSGIPDCYPTKQHKAHDLIYEYACIFFTKWFRFWKNINSQTFGQIDGLNTIQGMLVMHSSRTVWRSEGTYLRNIWYRCYSSIQ